VPEKKASTPKAKKAAMKVVKARKKKGAPSSTTTPATKTATKAAAVTPAKDAPKEEEEDWFLCPSCIRDLSEAETEVRKTLSPTQMSCWCTFSSTEYHAFVFRLGAFLFSLFLFY
jgi:hypothetical protein